MMFNEERFEWQFECTKRYMHFTGINDLAMDLGESIYFYDSNSDIEYLDHPKKKESIELADYMIELWTKYKEKNG